MTNRTRHGTHSLALRHSRAAPAAADLLSRLHLPYCPLLLNFACLPASARCAARPSPPPPSPERCRRWPQAALQCCLAIGPGSAHVTHVSIDSARNAPTFKKLRACFPVRSPSLRRVGCRQHFPDPFMWPAGQQRRPGPVRPGAARRGRRPPRPHRFAGRFAQRCTAKTGRMHLKRKHDGDGARQKNITMPRCTGP